MFKVLVTGGAGFIGSHLVEKLVNLNYQVKVLDNFSSGRISNLRCVKGKAKIVRGDIRDKKVLGKVVKNVDTIIHLAALTDVTESVRKPHLYHEVNTTGTLNLLHTAEKNKVQKFVYISTCAVYGEAKKLPINEEHPTAGLSPYAVSKLAAENYCRVYNEVYGLKTVILRLFNVYGPGQQNKSYSGVIIRFIEMLNQNKPPIIYGDGEQTRDFVYVGDVVEAIVKAVESNISFDIFNIGTGEPTTINHLAETIIRVMGKENLKPIHTEPRKGEIRHSQADITKAKEKLGYKPQTNLTEGLKKTVLQLSKTVF